jgi:hypothetical protein
MALKEEEEDEEEEEEEEEEERDIISHSGFMAHRHRTEPRETCDTPPGHQDKNARKRKEALEHLHADVFDEGVEAL